MSERRVEQVNPNPQPIEGTPDLHLETPAERTARIIAELNLVEKLTRQDK